MQVDEQHNNIKVEDENVHVGTVSKLSFGGGSRGGSIGGEEGSSGGGSFGGGGGSSCGGSFGGGGGSRGGTGNGRGSGYAIGPPGGGFGGAGGVIYPHGQGRGTRGGAAAATRSFVSSFGLTLLTVLSALEILHYL